MRITPFAALAAVLGLAPPACPSDVEYFVPAHRLAGIGAGRQELTAEDLAMRTEAMIQAQTFSIMREPQALVGAQRVHGPDLQRLFQEAERKSGFPASVLQAIAYLESWGNEKAESPTGPRGIMQISLATGKRMGLKISYAVRYRVTKTKTPVRNKHGKLVYRTVRHKVPYTVPGRDERLKPEKAIPAAALYLAGLEQRYGGRDWAIWAYHCGEGCVADFLSMVRSTRGPDGKPATVASSFFGASPVWNRALYEAIRAQMDRDYSPTYWFRVMRAEQLLGMYLNDPTEFQDLVEQYKYRTDPGQRAPDRLSVWLRAEDLRFDAAAEAMHGGQESKLASAPDDPAFFGYRLAGAGAHVEPGNWRPQAFPSTIGTLAYIAFETRRLYDAMRPAEPFLALDVTSLLAPRMAEPGAGERAQAGRATEHASGQVFDISVVRLPPAERECLQFVLDDLGWNGYLGFIQDPPGRPTLHIGCSPSSRDFFARVFDDGQAALRIRTAPAVIPASSPAPGEHR